MPLRNIQLHGFRNYRELNLKLDAEITVFTGKNGIGKTTILEAVSLLGSGRTFRNARNSDLIRNGEVGGQISGEVESQGLLTHIKIKVYPQGKKVYLDEKLAKSSEQLFDILPTIVFSPADHRIIDGDSSDRKQFLNRAAANVDWDYVQDLNAYTKALNQRNRILKDASAESWSQTKLKDILEVWDEQLLQYGTRLLVRRHYYLSELAPCFTTEYQRISLTNDAASLHYQFLGDENHNAPDNEIEVREIFQKKLFESMRRDLVTGTTQVGPHKDEILLTLNGNKVKFYGSQGEKRTCALALRLGELSLYRAKQKKPPMLLFDDVSSELDKMRRQSLVELLRMENTQVLITATELPSTLMDDVGKKFEHLDLNTVGVRD